ncbi:Crp/Fnr family transcriptional regulator [Cohnella fermenti]|uniref:Crp/Fnr family transcriptional regulator n=1 Tax=Cohnella fermenti TaxID=2565925 RepID=UPI001454C778|nr:Crp/Fnr family transcriptional regulator [Cohnella fermenti]
MTSATTSILRAFRPFRNLTEEELAAIAELCVSRHYARGDYLFLQSDEISHVYLPVQGRVRLYSMSESGKEQTFLLADPGELFPHVGFFLSGNYPYHAVALQEAVCYALPVRSFERLLAAHPSIHFKITQVLADKILELQRRLEAKTFYSTEGQLISLLLRLTEEHGCGHEGEWRKLSASLTNGELAGLLGASRETVNRMLSKLKKNQAVLIGEDGSIKVSVKRLRGMLPSASEAAVDADMVRRIRHHSDQCCVSGGHEL